LVHGDLTKVLDLVLQTTGTWMRVGNFGISYFMSSVEKCLIVAVSAMVTNPKIEKSLPSLTENVMEIFWQENSLEL